MDHRAFVPRIFYAVLLARCRPSNQSLSSFDLLCFKTNLSAHVRDQLLIWFLQTNQMKILDVGIFKFEIPEHNLPEKVAQIQQRIERLMYLDQLAKGV